MRLLATLALLALSALSTGAQVAGKAAIGGKASIGGGPTPLPTISQSCINNASGTSVSCATTAAQPTINFTAGQLIVAVAWAGNGLLSTLPTGSGSGCPSTWTNISNGTDSLGGNFSASYGTTQAGSCTVSQAQTGTAAGMFMQWYVMINTTGHIDGTGAWLPTNVGAGTTTGASYTTTHSGDLILALVVELSASGDSTFAAVSPFSSAQLSTGFGAQGWPQMAASTNQNTSGTTTLTWTQGVSTKSLSWVQGVY